MGYFNHDHYVELTMHFRCNLKCEHCMIEETMDRLEPESIDDFEQLIESNRRLQRWQGIVFTGSEITLRSDLPELARRARENGFEHVRIQTHGMRLANRDYCHELVDAGIDEYFVSVTAADADTHDRITEVPGSFAKTIQGLENLDEFDDVVTFTNTVITKRSYQQLPRVVQRLGHLRRLVQMDFWNYWPMSETDEKELIVSHSEVLPYLIEAIGSARSLGREVEVKNFPECMLGDCREALDNNQPKLVIDPEFWQEFQRNGFHQCVHQESCSSTKCLGLNTAYVKKFGWESELLTPFSSRAETDRATYNSDSFRVGDSIGDDPRTGTDQCATTSPPLLQLVEQLDVRLTTERSFRICHGQLDTNRFLISVNKRSIRSRPNQTIMGLCRSMKMPEQLLVGVGQRLSASKFVHFGYEQRDGRELYKVYLEFGLPTHAHSDPVLLHLAFKWDGQDHSRQVITTYTWLPSLTPDEIQERIARIYEDGPDRALEIVSSFLDLAETRMRNDEIRYLEVSEEQNQRKSFDLNLYDANLQIADLGPLLSRMCAQHQISDHEFGTLFNRIQLEPFGHLAGGIHREGDDFFNVYYGVNWHKALSAAGFPQ